VVLSAGSVTHFLIAIVAIYGAAVASGLPTERAVVGQVQPCVVIGPEANGAVRDCRAGDPVAPAATAGLRAGDRIVRVGDTEIRTFTDLLTTLRANPGRTVPVTVVRDGRQQTVTM